MLSRSVISPLVIRACRIKLTAIILAAGQASRFGSAKQLAVVDGQPLLNRIIEQYKQANIDSLFIVLGAHYQNIKVSIPAEVQITYCQAWQLGMSQSIKSGLSNISQETTHVLLGLADQINLNCLHLQQLIGLSNANPEMIIAAKYNDILGSPVIFPRSYFSDLEKLNGDKGARAILQQYVDSIIPFDCNELACDIDTQQDLINWQNRN